MYAIYICYIYIYYAGTFNMPTSYQQWVWEREANIYWSMVTCLKAALVRNHLEDYWHSAGGPSAVNE